MGLHKDVNEVIAQQLERRDIIIYDTPKDYDQAFGSLKRSLVPNKLNDEQYIMDYVQRGIGWDQLYILLLVLRLIEIKVGAIIILVKC